MYIELQKENEQEDVRWSLILLTPAPPNNPLSFLLTVQSKNFRIKSGLRTIIPFICRGKHAFRLT